MPRTLASAWARSSAVSSGRGAALRGAEGVDALIDGGVEEERQDGRGGAVDRHGDGGRRRDEVEAVVERLHVVQGGHRDAGGADLAVDVGALVGVAAVEGDRVEGGGQAGGGLALGEELETPVGAERVTLAGEHPRRVLAVTLEGEHPGGEGEVAGEVLPPPETHQFTVVGEAGQCDARDPVPRQGLAGQLGADLLVPHLDHLFVAGVGGDDRGPAGEPLRDVVRELSAGRVEQRPHVRVVRSGLDEFAADRLQALHPPCRLGQPAGLGVVGADGVGDLGQVAHPVRRDHLPDTRGVTHVDLGQRALGQGQTLVGQSAPEVLVQGGDPVVVERGRGGAVHRHVLRPHAERLAVAHQLAAHVAHRVLRAAPFELVDGHDVGEVEHVDLLQLRGGAELRRHHVQRGVDERHDRRVALPDARCLHDHQVEPGRLDHVDHVGQMLRQLTAAAGGQAAEEHPVAVEGVHPDPVAEQRTASPAAGRVDRDHGDPQLVLLVDPEPAHQFVRQRRLARAAGARDAEHRHRARRARGPYPVQELGGQLAQFRARDGAGDREPVARQDGGRVGRFAVPQVEVALPHDRVDHPGQAHPLPVLGGEDGHPARPQPGDLLGHDDTAPAAHHADVLRTLRTQRLDQVLEVLHVPALVGRDGHTVGVLLQRRVHDLLTDRLCPRWITSAPWDWKIRRMMLIDASCPSNRAEAVTRRTGCTGRCRSLMGPSQTDHGSSD